MVLAVPENPCRDWEEQADDAHLKSGDLEIYWKMVNKETRRKIRNFLLIAMLLCFIPFCERTKMNTKADSGETFESGEIRAAFEMSNDMYGKQGLRAGMNYEMLRQFAHEHGCRLSATASRRDENWMDSLRLGVVDLVITEFSDTVSYDGLRLAHSVDNIVWAVKAENAGEEKDINLWLKSFMSENSYKNVRNRFYSNYNPVSRAAKGEKSRRISPYDELIKKYAEKLGWDWRLLAAVIWHESKFSINGVSPRGCRGLMQVRPSTAKTFGVEHLMDPEENIFAGTEYLRRLGKLYDSNVSDPLEKVKFTLAAYNAGEGRIADCRNYAAKKDVDSTRWDEVVKIIPEMREDTILLEDSVKLGKFKGYETISYVATIMDLYETICSICPES